MIKISIIVPVYKVERYIHKCIKSVLMQTYTDFELILVDDGSPDKCGEICDEYRLKDNRIRVIHKKNEGLMAAWIDGVQASCGDYIVFIDSDDWVENNMLESMVGVLLKNNVDLISCNFIKDFTNKQIINKNYFKEGYYSKNKIQNIIYPNLINNGTFQGRGLPLSRWAKIIKKELIIKNLKYCNTSISFGEDLNIMFPILLDCSSIYIMNDKSYFYHYRMNDDSILHTYNSTMYKQVVCLYKILFNVSIQKEKYDFSSQLLSDYLAACVQCFKNELMSKNRIKKIAKQNYSISKDEILKNALSKVDYKEYSNRNKFIITVLKSKNKFIITIASTVLLLIKKLKAN